ncbi:MAG: hypothetical protein V2A66_04755 [Pseudomonadota bacterium]
MKTAKIIEGVGLKEVLREQVQEALLKQDVETTEMAEFYLVNLLDDFHSAERMIELNCGDFLDKPLAILFMEAANGDLPTRIRSLKRIGDSALVITGFFADRIRKMLVDLPYFISMGGAAYGNLADILDDQKTFADIYSELSGKFAEFAEVLSIVAPWNRAVSNTDLLRIYERWLSTGDQKLQNFLEEQGIATGGEGTIVKVQ